MINVDMLFQKHFQFIFTMKCQIHMMTFFQKVYSNTVAEDLPPGYPEEYFLLDLDQLALKLRRTNGI